MARSIALTLIAPLVLGAIAAGGLLFFFTQLIVLEDPAPLYNALGIAGAILVVSRISSWLDKPKGFGAALGSTGTGLAIGIGALAFISGLFYEPPGGQATLAWTVAAGAGLGLFQGHRHILRHLRTQNAPPKLWLGFLDPRELSALFILIGGYALFGAGAYNVYVAFGGFFPESGKGLTIGIAIYSLYGAKLLLGFASHDSGQAEAGFVGWMKANAVRNAIVILVLVAYAAFREDLAAKIPFFPLIEFGLGMAVFGFVLGRLRYMLQRQKAERSTASEVRVHVQKIDTLTEGEYESVARPVSRFLETGRGRADYESAVRETARLEGPLGEAVLEPVRGWREPPEPPPLPLVWAVASTLLAGALIGVGVGILVSRLAMAPLDMAIQAGCAVGGLALYALLDPCRAHRQPWMGVGFAVGGSLLLGVTTLWFLGDFDIPEWVTYAIYGAILLLAGLPAVIAWRDAQKPPPEPSATELPSATLTRGMQRARQWAGATAAALVVLLLFIPIVLEWLADRMKEWQPDAPAWQEFPLFYSDFLAGALWVMLGTGGAALMRFYGMGRAKPRILESERRRREARLALHKSVMARLGRV